MFFRRDCVSCLKLHVNGLYYSILNFPLSRLEKLEAEAKSAVDKFEEVSFMFLIFLLILIEFISLFVLLLAGE